LREWLPLAKREPIKKSRFSEEQIVAILREAEQAQ
jgi:hypothetical protein